MRAQIKMQRFSNQIAFLILALAFAHTRPHSNTHARTHTHTHTHTNAHTNTHKSEGQALFNKKLFPHKSHDTKNLAFNVLNKKEIGC